MKLRRSFILPSLVLGLGLVVVACGDDDTTDPVAVPGNDAGPDAKTDSGSDSGGNGNEGGTDGGTDSGDAGDGSTTAAPVITTTSLPGVIAGSAITTVEFAATGATPITWAVSKGALPAGLALATDGKLTGTPTATGDFTFSVKATNSAGSDEADFALTVAAPAANAFVLTTDNKIAAFSTTFPSGTPAAVAVTGLAAGDTLVSIDRRPQNGFIYGLGANSTDKSVTLYAIDPETNNAVPVGVAATSTPAIAGTTFGIDFNPSVDRVRVVTSAGQNFRLNPNTGGFVDSDSNPVNGLTADGALNGGTSTVGAETAYTNGTPNNGAITTQYTIAGTTLYVQNLPNAGTLTLPHPLANVESVFGFDIPSDVKVASNNAEVATGAGFGVVKLTGNATTQLVSINLPNGALTTVGAFPFNNIAGFTLAPATTSHAIIALSSNGTSLIRFDESTPGTTTTQAIETASLAAGETLVGIDFRPRTGQLYAFGVNAATNTGTLYLLDPQTGAATILGPSGLSGQIAFTTDGLTAVDFPAATTGWGFDFNPNADRVRVTTASGLNFRINPDTGALVDGNNGLNTAVTGNNPDGNITGGVDDVAYTNGSAVTLGAGITTEYALNATSDSLAIVTAPNVGTLGTPITIKLAGSTLDFTAIGGFDIPQSVKAAANNTPPTAGFGYAALTVGATTNLYKINLVDGTATSLGAIGAGTTAIGGLTVSR